jgi:hypothetical protein
VLFLGDLDVASVLVLVQIHLRHRVSHKSFVHQRRPFQVVALDRGAFQSLEVFGHSLVSQFVLLLVHVLLKSEVYSVQELLLTFIVLIKRLHIIVQFLNHTV